MNRLLPLVFAGQKVLLIASYWYHRFFMPRAKKRSVDWVVGPDELASMVYQIARSLPGSFSVSFTQDNAYEFEYDYGYRQQSSPRARALTKLVTGPLLLGRMLNQAKGMLYVGAGGFLIDSFDQRDFEFRYLKNKGTKLANYWCGSEIRSTRKMHELERETGLPNVSTYIGVLYPFFETELHERIQRERAEVADRYADVMFDLPVDQTSYLTGYREPFLYFMPNERFIDNSRKFDDLSHIVVTHATTSPVIRGTPLVRAAVARLKREGYDFEYLELIGVSNDKLLAEIARSHIALVQFYASTPTVFGIEAMAAQCAVLGSSDATIETVLPPGFNDAIMVTKHWEVYDNLKSLLEHPERIEPLAQAGQKLVRNYASAPNAGSMLKGILDSVLDGSYDPAARAVLSNEQIYGEQSSGKASGTAPK